MLKTKSSAMGRTLKAWVDFSLICLLTCINVVRRVMQLMCVRECSFLDLQGTLHFETITKHKHTPMFYLIPL